MNHLIVYAHPSSDSFSNEIMNVTKELSRERGYKTEIRDLYSIGFDPVLKASDLKGIHNGQIPDDIKRELNYIEWANVITIIYPVWWTGMPAVLKGYIDRVFSCSMAYKRGNGGKEELLKGKIVFLLSPMGTSNEDYGKSGMLDAMKQTCDVGIFKFCGMKVIKHVFFGSVSNVGEEMKKEYIKAVSIVFSKGLPSNKDDEESKNKKENKSNKEDESNKGNESSKEDENNRHNENSKDSENNKHSESSKDSGRKKDDESNKDNESNKGGEEESQNKNNRNSNEDYGKSKQRNSWSNNLGSNESDNNSDNEMGDKNDSNKKSNEKNKNKDN